LAQYKLRVRNTQDEGEKRHSAYRLSTLKVDGRHRPCFSQQQKPELCKDRYEWRA
ncbi:hypothetical protein U1Q18_049755, partial [Sarracenia purpurea var. burkii]